MKKVPPEQIIQMKIGKHTVEEWENRWEPFPDALSQPHPNLRAVIGLLRFRLSGKIMYFVRATELKGGIAKGIQRLIGPDQTGNRGFGAQMIRKHRDVLTVDLLPIEEPEDRPKVGKELKRALNKLHDPQWNWSHKRRMKAIRDGLITPD